MVLEDVESYAGLTMPVKTNFFARKIIRKMKINKLHPNPKEEIISKIRESNRVKCASFDLDEVLLTNDKVEFPLNLFYKKTLRKNADALIKELRDMGFDVWVYTGEYHSVSAIENLFCIIIRRWMALLTV